MEVLNGGVFGYQPDGLARARARGPHVIRVQDHQLIVLTQFFTPFRLHPLVLQALHHTQVLQLV